MSAHFIFTEGRINAKCGTCNEFTGLPHCDAGQLFCAGCCPCQKAPAERVGAVAGLVGEQGGLF